MQVRTRCLPFLFACFAAGGCARKLPGPAECRAFALASVGVEPSTPATALAYHPGLEARADEITRKCLTTPWDYQLLNCLSNGASTVLCLSQFQARQLGQ